MEVDNLIAILESDDDLMSVVGSLGQDCLDQRQAVENDRYLEIADMILRLRELAAEESVQMWGRDGARCANPTSEFKERLAKAAVTPSLATVTVLEGICFGAARVFFANASSVVGVVRGSVLPLPERWLANMPTTPRPATMHSNLLDERCNFVLWDLDWVVELDYTFRDRLDQVCAVRVAAQDRIDADGTIRRAAYELPKVATVHPFGGDDMGGPTWDHARRRFFGVRPKLPSDHSGTTEADAISRAQAHQQAFEALTQAREIAPIAVLPEFCLHSSDGLDALIGSSDHLALAALIVAGSAHTIGANGERSNTSHVFLDRHRILSVSKYEPFVIRSASAGGAAVDYVEDIRPLPKVLRLAAGTATRLAIAICSDLNSFDLLAAMTWAGVNILLSPSWTPKIGGSDRGLETLAGYCQCIGVIANTPGHLLALPDDPPFCACSAVPRERDCAHFHNYSEAPPVVGILNPNLLDTDADYWRWLT
jgi:hypothetical protein